MASAASIAPSAPSAAAHASAAATILPAPPPGIPSSQGASGHVATFNFKAILQEMVRQGASDLHLKVGRPPTLRTQGELTPLAHAAMRPEDLKSLAEQVMS